MNIGVVFAAGVGSRLGKIGRPKQFMEVNGKPVIVHTLEHFEKCSDIDEVVVVCLESWMDFMRNLAEEYSLQKVRTIVPGGETGQESIYRGLLAAKNRSGGEDAIVLIHDGVRPFISPRLLSENVRAVRDFGSAVTCGPMTETPVRVEGDTVTGAFTRPQIRIAKAPQSFWLNEILAAHEQARAQGKNDYLDSCSLMLQHKPNLHFIESGPENIKITEFEDVYLMQAYMRAREDQINYGGVIRKV